MATCKTILALVADEQGEVFEHPDLLLAGMNGTEVVRFICNTKWSVPVFYDS